MSRFANQYYKNMYGCFAGFCHHPVHVMITSAHTQAYHYPLFESGTKQIHEQLLFKKDIELTCKYKE